MTTYQKLKFENALLKKELDIVCNDENQYTAIAIKHKYKMLRAMENQIMAGTAILNKKNNQ